LQRNNAQINENIGVFITKLTPIVVGMDFCLRKVIVHVGDA